MELYTCFILLYNFFREDTMTESTFFMWNYEHILYYRTIFSCEDGHSYVMVENLHKEIIEAKNKIEI